jgi:uncharacterized tellurite resistance protein B-like protein
MPPTNADHPALKLSDAERKDYAMLIATMVFADGVVDPAEQVLLENLCKALSVADAAGLLAVAKGKQRVDMVALAAKFKDHEIRQSLLTDAIVMAYADGKVVDAEAEAIGAIAKALQFTPSQAAMMGRFVATVEGASPGMQAPLDSMFGRKLAKGIGTGEMAAIKDPEKQAGIIKWLFKKLRAK